MATIKQQINIDREEAIRRINAWNLDPDDMEILSVVIPELKEKGSKDDRTRKELIAYCQVNMGHTWHNIKKEDYIAWLEKQGEPTDINPSEFDLRLNKLLKQFETLPKEELESSLSFYLNVVQNDGTYKADEKQGEQKPTTEMKSAEESLGIDSDTYNKIVDECIYGEQKPAETEKGAKGNDREIPFSEQEPVLIIPKFRVGDEIETPNEESLTITKIDEKGYWSNDLFICDFENECIWDLVEQKSAANCLLNWSEKDEKMFQSLEGIVKDYWAKAEQEKNEIKIREASDVSFFLKTIQKLPLCWIKCSDELPKKDGTYLVVTDGSHNDVYDMARYDSIDGWHKASKIIYWMPIPQLNNKSIIEQKPADKVEPFDEYGGLTDFERTLANICIGWIGQELGWKQYIKDNADVLLKIAIEKFNSVQDAPFEQKPWSEEDELMLGKCIDAASGYYSPENKQSMKDWLYSIKDRYTWKPSDEQIRELSIVTTGKGWFSKEVLSGLLEQLKQL